MDRELLSIDEALNEMKKNGFYLSDKETALKIRTSMLTPTINATLLISAHLPCPDGFSVADTIRSPLRDSGGSGDEGKVFELFRPYFDRTFKLECMPDSGSGIKKNNTGQVFYDERVLSIKDVPVADLCRIIIANQSEYIGVFWLFTPKCKELLEFDGVWVSKQAEISVLMTKRQGLLERQGSNNDNEDGSKRRSGFFLSFFQREIWHYILVLAISLRLFNVGQSRLRDRLQG